MRSVGFQLSVAAAGAIVLVAPALTDALPGPRTVREPLAVTVAAQLGVAPVLLATFGPLPVASFPANLLAVPAAGLVMVWGLTAGLLAGFAGGWVAELVHQATRLLLIWLVEVAGRCARLPLGELDAAHVLGVAAGLAAAVAGHHVRSSTVWRAGLAVASLSLLAAVVVVQAPVPLRSDLMPGVVRWHDRSAEVVVLGGAGGRTPLGAEAVLAALRQAHVAAIDLVVVADPSVSGAVVTAVERRHPIGSIVVAGGAGPFDVRAPVVAAPRPRARLEVGSVEVLLTVTADRLVVEAQPGGTLHTPR